MVGLIVLVFVDLTGPAHWTTGTIISTHYSEGITTHTEIDVGKQRQGTYDDGSSGLMDSGDRFCRPGEAKRGVDGNTFGAGQPVYLQYKIGKLTGTPKMPMAIQMNGLNLIGLLCGRLGNTAVLKGSGLGLPLSPPRAFCYQVRQCGFSPVQGLRKRSRSSKR